jgi:hypothetical protein
MTNPVTPGVVLTVKEYAALVGVKIDAVYRAIYKGYLPYPLERPRGGGYYVRVPKAAYARLSRKADAA